MKKLIVILILLSSCTVQKRCERHLEKAKSMGCLIIKNDTIVKYDTIRGFRLDTVVQFYNEVDTLYLDSGSVKTRIIMRWKDKIVTVNQVQKDTIVKNQLINSSIETIKVISKIPWWIYVIMGALGVALLLVIIKK